MDYNYLLHTFFDFASTSFLGFCMSSVMFGYYGYDLLKTYMIYQYEKKGQTNIYEINCEFPEVTEETVFVNTPFNTCKQKCPKYCKSLNDNYCNEDYDDSASSLSDSGAKCRKNNLKCSNKSIEPIERKNEN